MAEDCFPGMISSVSPCLCGKSPSRWQGAYNTSEMPTEQIWDSIADSVELVDIPQSHKDEFDRRLQAMQDDPRAGSTWEEVRSRLQGKSGAP